MNGARTYLEHDWYRGSIPANVVIGRNVYIDTAYSFASFLSEQSPGLTLGDACGAYDRTSFVTGPSGRITVGAYTVLNGTYLICNDQITIGAHCLLAWGSVITDSWIGRNSHLDSRREVLQTAARDPARHLPPAARPRSVVLEDNVWVGFDAVVLPGTTLGRGCVVGCRTVVAVDVPPYAVVVGDPPRVVRFLEPDDSDAARKQALREYARV